MNAKNLSLSLVDSQLLEKIDALFASNVGSHVDLPQLIVVGQQSSGKSSVLEGLTELPFPRDSSLCTRFATQIIFRRSNVSHIRASIKPSTDSSPDHQAKMEAWEKIIPDLDPETFAGIMKEVIDLMGVGESHEVGSPAFSKDVLVLEVTGPDQEHFSVIDVPGTFRNTIAGVTTAEDIALVDGMVRGYMENPRSVMLTVVPCNDDIANQGIVEQAKHLDPKGDRTLGVLTKPDLVDRGAEKKIIELLEGKWHPLKLGWHLLRNPGQAELEENSKSRNQLERQFFATKAPWNAVDKDKVGIDSLRPRLQEILAVHIRREFPNVKAELQKKLRDATSKLKKLGPKRQDQSQQREFLMAAAVEFQKIAEAAIRAEYWGHEFFDIDEEGEHRLATRVVVRSDTFVDLVVKLGHEFDFLSLDGDDEASTPETRRLSKSPETPGTRTVSSHPDIKDILVENELVEAPGNQSKILPWIKGVYSRNRGFEIGTFKDTILISTLKEQAQKWKSLAEGYISDMASMVHSFVLALLEHIVPDTHVLEGLKSLLSERLRDTYRDARSRTQFLLHIELEGTPVASEVEFSQRLKNCNLEEEPENPPKTGDQVVQKIHDNLMTYYNLARTRFIDNIRMQAAYYSLVTGPSTPLKLFTPQFVAGLAPEQLGDVAGEDPSLRRQRAELERDIKQLEKAIEILR